MSDGKEERNCSNSEDSSPFRYFANGTPLTERMHPTMSTTMNSSTTISAPLISVVSYNLLAPAYVRPVDRRTGCVQTFAAFEWVSDDRVLVDWPSRSARLRQALRNFRADVLCLQELQMERTNANANANNDNEGILVLPQWIQPLLVDYEACLPPPSELENIATRNRRVLEADAAVTCAVLYRKEKFTRVQEKFLETNANQKKPYSRKKHRGGDTNRCVSVCLCLKTNAQLLPPLVVSSVHLDAMNEKTRVRQLTACLRRVQSLARQACGGGNSSISRPEPMVTIVAGDMNQEFRPASCVASLLRGTQENIALEDDLQYECAKALRLEPPQVPSEAQMKEWKDLREEARQTARDCCVSLDRIKTGGTLAAYDPGMSSEQARDVASATVKLPRIKHWRLDHILYTTDSLRPVAAWSTLEADAESREIGMPNYRCPSDHLPIATIFEVTPPVPLPKEETLALLNRFRDLQSAQTKELEEVQARFDAERADLESNEIGGKTSSRPTKKVMECVHQRRAAVKEIKVRQRIERKVLVEKLSDLERLVMQHEFACSADEWAERG